MTMTSSIPPIEPPCSLPQVTDAELALYAALIYERTGVHISPRKQTLLSNRLRRRLRETGIASFSDYYQHLRRLPPADPEWDAFLQEITTHETYLFRDEAQWTWFRGVYLPGRSTEGPANRSLRIWSAACSTGDEAFTAACCIASCLPNFRQWKIAIVGTDIGVGAVHQARAAVFGDRAMRLVPGEYRRAYFTEIRHGQAWQAKPVLVQMTSFRQHNLLHPLNERPFDVVFLKNVLIYFDQASKRRALANVASLVRPGGMLIVGASEGLADLLKDCVRIQPWLYRRPENKRERP
jgi:chemotaxis protein methyltransferase CheR